MAPEGIGDVGIVCLQGKIANIVYVYNGESFEFCGYVFVNGENNRSFKPKAVHATKEELIEHLNNTGALEAWEERKSELGKALEALAEGVEDTAENQ